MGKGSKERIVMVGTEAMDTLRKHIEILNGNDISGSENYLFPPLRKGKYTL